jgi:glucose/mannose-6-phosphate isomerase
VAEMMSERLNELLALAEEVKKEKFSDLVLLGMGGSQLVADVALNIKPDLPLLIHGDYGLPQIPESDWKNSLVVANSYSGNTEEVVSGLNAAVRKKLPTICISIGGELSKIAQKKKLPYILIPNTGIQPRSAVGFNLMALLKVMGEEKLLRECSQLAKKLKPNELETSGQSLAARLKDRVPVIYSSERNFSIAYNWKIKFNETGKIPAFYNVLPEMNHNEMNGFDVKDGSRHLSQNFYFIFLHDPADHPQIQKRMNVARKLYTDRGLKSEVIELLKAKPAEKIFTALLLADWAAVHTALSYNLEPEQVPMIEEFKKLIA